MSLKPRLVWAVAETLTVASDLRRRQEAVAKAPATVFAHVKERKCAPGNVFSRARVGREARGSSSEQCPPDGIARHQGCRSQGGHWALADVESVTRKPQGDSRPAHTQPNPKGLL